MDDSGRTGRPGIDEEMFLLDMETAARCLGISRSHAYALASQGELPGVVRLGGTLRVSGRLVEAWIDSHRDELPKPLRTRTRTKAR